MSKKLTTVFDGTLGHFWTSETDEVAQEAQATGYVKQLENGLIEVESLLDPTDDFLALTERNIPKVESAQGLVRETTIQLTDRAGHAGSWHIGGRASVDILRFRCVMVDVPIDRMNSSKVIEVSAYFRDLLGWAGMTTLKRVVRRDESGRTKGASYLLDTEDQVHELRITANTTLRVEPSWRTSEDGESAFIYTYLKIGISCKNPMHVSDLATGLEHVRRLLSTVYQRDIWAESCTAKIDADRFDRRVELWHQKLNFTTASALDPSRDDPRPYLNLDQLGGIRSLVRWIRLSESFPRLTQPIASYWQASSKMASVEVAEMAMTIEYCVAVTKRLKKRPKWTQENPPAVALAKKVGKAFDEWSSNAEEWGLLFWDTYNHLKHNHTHRDPRQVAVMAASARVLLTAYLISRIAENGSAARKFLSDYRWEPLCEMTHEYVSASRLRFAAPKRRKKK